MRVARTGGCGVSIHPRSFLVFSEELFTDRTGETHDRGWLFIVVTDNQQRCREAENGNFTKKL